MQNGCHLFQALHKYTFTNAETQHLHKTHPGRKETRELVRKDEIKHHNTGPETSAASLELASQRSHRGKISTPHALSTKKSRGTSFKELGSSYVALHE